MYVVTDQSNSLCQSKQMILEEMKIESGQKQTIKIFECQWEDFPDGPMVKTLPFNQGVWIQSLARKL